MSLVSFLITDTILPPHGQTCYLHDRYGKEITSLLPSAGNLHHDIAQ